MHILYTVFCYLRVFTQIYTKVLKMQKVLNTENYEQIYLLITSAYCKVKCHNHNEIWIGVSPSN